MLILISQLIGQPVVVGDDAESIGIVRHPIIDPANGKLVGYFFGQGFLFMRQAIVAATDIVGYDAGRLAVQNAEVARKIDDEPKIKAILAKKLPVLSAKVVTESGLTLGRANDLLLDTELDMIVRYYVHGLLSDRIIAAEHVIRIDKKGIIVDDTASVATVAAEAKPIA